LPTPLPWQRLLDWLLSSHQPRRMRTSMALLALLLMVASALVMLLVAKAGVAPLRYVRWWAVISVGGVTLLCALIRSGWSERMRDPSLTIAQMLWTITCGAVAYVIAGQARGIVPAVLAMIFFFGTFSLRTGQILGIGLYTLAAFALAITFSPHYDGTPYGVLDSAYAAMVALVLLGCMALNLRIQRIRARMLQQRTELSRALILNRELATRDELTGLLNRRHMLELMHLEQRRAERSGRNLVVALLDIDHFKHINDNHGHSTGDRALQLFSTAVRSSVRGTDVLARWGGEEFVLLISDTATDDAADLLERVRCAVAAQALPHAGGPICFTVSIGMAVYQAGESIEHTLERADKALYAAKNSGRDRVMQAMHIPPPQAQTA
jgi:diguanylate cyclase (GGDEF)-like protein